MKTLSTKHIALIGSIVFMVGLTSNARTVQEAYELRLGGDADAALALLEQAVAVEPKNAGAWYELARTKAHIGLGNPRSIMETLKESQAAAEKAAKLEPDNLIYAVYKAKACGTGAYIALQQQAPDAKNKLQEYISSYEHVLELEPDYHEARLSLVEYLKMLPPEKGGDSAKAEKYARELEKADAVLGAQAREMMLPEDTDLVAYWQKVLERNPGNADVLERLGKEAKSLDPNFSKATGIPDQNLFIPPDQIPHGFVYFTRPF